MTRPVFLSLLLCAPAAPAAAPVPDPSEIYIGAWAGYAKLESGQVFDVSISIKRNTRGIFATYNASPKKARPGRVSGSAQAVKKGETGPYSVRLKLDNFRNFSMPASASVTEDGRLTVESVIFSGIADANKSGDEVRFRFNSRMGSGQGSLTKKPAKKPAAAGKNKPEVSRPAPVDPGKLKIDTPKPD